MMRVALGSVSAVMLAVFLTGCGEAEKKDFTGSQVLLKVPGMT
jgi:uncharacterized lipoprotein YehR (DUF1307 family)